MSCQEHGEPSRDSEAGGASATRVAIKAPYCRFPAPACRDFAKAAAGSGKIAAARPLPLYLQAVVISGPLHFGDYGGLALKLLWLANAWGAFFITGSGAWLWWAKRKRARRPAPLIAPLPAE